MTSLQTRLLSILTICTHTLAWDTDWPHYGRNGIVYQGTNYIWSACEMPHKIRWHDGYDGPELVRVELATNSVKGATCYNPLGHFEEWYHIRVLRYIIEGVTNEVALKFLGIETREIKDSPSAKCNCACCFQPLLKLTIDDVKLLLTSTNTFVPYTN